MKCWFYHDLKWTKGTIRSISHNNTLRFYGEDNKEVFTLHDWKVIFHTGGMSIIGYLQGGGNNYFEVWSIQVRTSKPKNLTSKS